MFLCCDGGKVHVLLFLCCSACYFRLLLCVDFLGVLGGVENISIPPFGFSVCLHLQHHCGSLVPLSLPRRPQTIQLLDPALEGIVVLGQQPIFFHEHVEGELHVPPLFLFAFAALASGDLVGFPYFRLAGWIQRCDCWSCVHGGTGMDWNGMESTGLLVLL